jgi:hypothetical protein
MKRIILAFLIIVFFNSCTEESQETCEARVCTQMYATLSVKFIDFNGKPVVVKNYQSKNLRTGKLLNATFVTDTINYKGYYYVVTDANLKDLSDSDKVLVSAKHPVTNVLKQAEFTISGGECACHVGKIAGPDEIRF